MGEGVGSPGVATSQGRLVVFRHQSSVQGLVRNPNGAPRGSPGAFGGPTVSRSGSNFPAIGPDVFGPSLRLVGDSVFAAAGVMAAVLSATWVVARVTGSTWAPMRMAEPLAEKAGIASEKM